MKDNTFPLFASIFAYLLCLFVLVLGNTYEAGFNVYYGWIHPIFPCFILYWLVRYMQKIGLIVAILCWLLIISEIFCLFFYHTPYSIHIVQLLLNTTASESSNFIREAIISRSFAYSILLSLGTATIAYGSIKLLNLCSSSLHYLRYVGIGILLSSLGLLSYSYITLVQRFKEPDIRYFIMHRDDKPCYFTPITRLMYGFAYTYDSSFLQEKIKNHLQEAEVEICTYDSPLIVLVIGESYDKYHTPLYQPDYRNTTPYLCELKDQDSLLVFDDVVAPFNLTSEVFHALFSTCPYNHLDEWYDYPLFPAIFKKAGYKVSFISNQYALHNNDIWNHQMGGMFNSPEVSELQYTYHNKDVFDFDEKLLGLLPEPKSLSSSPHLLIIHFIGQHVSYEERYPESFRYYSPNETKTKFGGSYGQKIVADYDNSLRYNDYVMHKLIEYIKPLDAVLIYFADHGEEVYDWRDAFMRTSEPTISAEVAKYQYSTPFVVYMTSAYQTNHPEIVQTMTSAVHLPIINTDIPNVLFHLAGINTPTYYQERDFLSPKYDSSVPRILRYDVDYNTLMNDY